MASYHPIPGKQFKKHNSGRGWKPFEAASIADLSKYVIGCAWSPNEWAEGHRTNYNFIKSDYMALDFDSGETSLAEAIRNFCDCKHVIGLTRNHQKEKKGLICDRFRVVIPWEMPITNTNIYGYNMGLALSRYSIDPAALDPGRFFFPCTEIVSISEDGYTQEVAPLSQEWFNAKKQKEENNLKFLQLAAQRYRDSGQLPKEIIAFKNTGKLIREGRNNTAFLIALKFAYMGWTEQEAYGFLLDCNYERTSDFNGEREFKSAVRSAFKSAIKNFNYIQGNGL